MRRKKFKFTLSLSRFSWKKDGNFITLLLWTRTLTKSGKFFAGKKKPSMKRRCVGHDYTRRGIYMVTLIVEGRKNLFGRVYGSIDASTYPFIHIVLLLLSIAS